MGAPVGCASVPPHANRPARPARDPKRPPRRLLPALRRPKASRSASPRRRSPRRCAAAASARRRSACSSARSTCRGRSSGRSGPFVDAFSSDRFGRRRTWILAMQIGMMATLLARCSSTSSASSACSRRSSSCTTPSARRMDVAIDALAVSVLPEHERGSANGFMFAGASIGQAIGGSGVLFLTAVMPFSVDLLLRRRRRSCSITVFVVLPLREKAGRALSGRRAAARDVGRELADFVRDAWRAFTGSRAALVGVLVALLPAGAYALSLALQSNLAVELGLDDNAVAQLNLVLDGRSSRRRASSAAGSPTASAGAATLALFVFLTVVPTLWLAWAMWQAGWIMPVDVKTAEPAAARRRALIVTFWAATIVYNVFQGLYYGIRSALFMDVTTPAVAATQFTAYMAMMNLCISYTASWQGYVVERIGYPATLVARLGRRPRRPAAAAADAAAGRADAGSALAAAGAGRRRRARASRGGRARRPARRCASARAATIAHASGSASSANAGAEAAAPRRDDAEQRRPDDDAEVGEEERARGRLRGLADRHDARDRRQEDAVPADRRRAVDGEQRDHRRRRAGRRERGGAERRTAPSRRRARAGSAARRRCGRRRRPRRCGRRRRRPGRRRARCRRRPASSAGRG